MLHRSTSLGPNRQSRHHPKSPVRNGSNANATLKNNNSENNNMIPKKKRPLFPPTSWSSRLYRFSSTSCFVTAVLCILFYWFWFLSSLMNDERYKGTIRIWHKPKKNLSATSSSFHHCNFRRYPTHRYYHLFQPKQPDFLMDTEYIYGEWPILLPQLNNVLTKVCVDQRKWWNTNKHQPPAPSQERMPPWPFADGTNPSLLSMERVPASVAELIQNQYPTTHYLVTVCMTNSQCTWKDTADLATKFDLPTDFTQTQPNTVRTIIQLLDMQLQVLAETTILLKRDAPWGKKMRQIPTDAAAATLYHIPALDDARLFVYKEQVYVSYREGPGFGYETQVLNPIHWTFGNQNESSSSLHVEIWASESSSFCCGRNMALLEDFLGNSNRQQPNHHPQTSDLYALTWVDPVTVEKVDTTPNEQRKMTKTKQQQHPVPKRRLAATTTTVHKSHIHGTNAFMVPVPDAPGVYLGVAHFHRPNDRRPNEYARFGHHYTHAFYTVKPGESSSTLVALSPEFVLPSFHKPDDAEIIQFVSGLEIIHVPGNDDDETTPVVILAYGINDCEAAITTIDWKAVQSFLRPVAPGKQVVDFMKKAIPPTSSSLSFSRFRKKAN